MQRRAATAEGPPPGVPGRAGRQAATAKGPLRPSRSASRTKGSLSSPLRLKVRFLRQPGSTRGTSPPPFLISAPRLAGPAAQAPKVYCPRGQPAALAGAWPRAMLKGPTNLKEVAAALPPSLETNPKAARACAADASPS
jgi:hypothetical protein